MYLGAMKTKQRRKANRQRARVNALVDLRNKRLLMQASEAQDRTMTAVLNDLLSSLEGSEAPKVGPGIGDAWVDENIGILEGKFTKADYKRDDLLGHILRKHG